MRTRAVLIIGAGLGVMASAPAAVSADSFNPVRVTVHVAPVARLHQPLIIRVDVNADAGALDPRSGPVRMRVKLAGGECGGDYATTHGVVLLDRVLRPQPAPGEPYSGSASGSGRPVSYGPSNLCIFLTDDYKQFDSDTTDYQVNVSRPCTARAARYDADVRALKRALANQHRARGKLRRRRAARTVRARRAAVRGARKAAAQACGPGVPL